MNRLAQSLGDMNSPEQQASQTLTLADLSAWALNNPMPFDDTDLSERVGEVMRDEFADYLAIRANDDEQQ